MKRYVLLFTLICSLLCCACTAPDLKPAEEETPKQVELSGTQMKAICELATMEFFYHNVAKFTEEDAEGFLFWKKDKRFWIEYSGIIKMGIDASKLTIDVQDDVVTITMPKAKVLEANVDKSSLTEDAFIVASDSAKLTAEDATMAYKEAQLHMEETAAKDTASLQSAERRAQVLLEDYVRTMGELSGINYRIVWKELKENTGVSLQ